MSSCVDGSLSQISQTDITFSDCTAKYLPLEKVYFHILVWCERKLVLFDNLPDLLAVGVRLSMIIVYFKEKNIYTK